MPISGPDAISQLLQARRIAHQALVECYAEGDLTGQELRDLADDAKRATGDWANRALPPERRDRVVHLWRDLIEAEIQALESRRQRTARAASDVAELERQRGTAERELTAITATLDEQRQRQQHSAEALAQQLGEDDAFRAGSAQAAQIEAALERAEAGLAEVEYDAMQKLPAFERSRLFKYLYDRRVGTPRYSAGNFHRRIDAWISDLIGYPQARTDYDFLKNTPVQIRTMIALHRDALSPVMRELERRRDERAEMLGLTQVAAQAIATEQVRATALVRLEQLRRDGEAARREWAESERLGGDEFARAVELIQIGLEQTATLGAATDRSGEAVDGVASTGWADVLQPLAARLEQLQRDALRRQQQLEVQLQLVSELGYFHQRFCSAGFASSLSQFDDSLDLVREWEEVRLGNDSTDLVWQRMRRRQQFIGLGGEAPAEGRPLGGVLRSAMELAASGPTGEFARRAADRWAASHRGGWGPLGIAKRPQPVRFGSRV